MAPYVAVLTVDQRGSRRGSDRVPGLLADLTASGADLLLDFERTAGDEVQGVVAEPAALTTVVGRILRAGDWAIGIGVGRIERPLPDHTRAGRGPAYLAAREAVDRAKHSSRPIRVVGADDYPASTAPRLLEDAIWLWASVLDRRTEKGWSVVDLLSSGLSHEATAQRLGVTQSAVTQRAKAAGFADEERARELVAHLAGQTLVGDSDG